MVSAYTHTNEVKSVKSQTMSDLAPCLGKRPWHFCHLAVRRFAGHLSVPLEMEWSFPEISRLRPGRLRQLWGF